jgi:hypothetical protein
LPRLRHLGGGDKPYLCVAQGKQPTSP